MSRRSRRVAGPRPSPSRVSGHRLSELLEPRLLMASITGNVFDDIDGDGVLETGDRAIPGVTVFLDQDFNFRLERRQVTRTNFNDLAIPPTG